MLLQQSLPDLRSQFSCWRQRFGDWVTQYHSRSPLLKSQLLSAKLSSCFQVNALSKSYCKVSSNSHSPVGQIVQLQVLEQIVLYLFGVLVDLLFRAQLSGSLASITWGRKILEALVSTCCWVASCFPKSTKGLNVEISQLGTSST